MTPLLVGSFASTAVVTHQDPSMPIRAAKHATEACYDDPLFYRYFSSSKNRFGFISLRRFRIELDPISCHLPPDQPPSLLFNPPTSSNHHSFISPPTPHTPFVCQRSPLHQPVPPLQTPTPTTTPTTPPVEAQTHHKPLQCQLPPKPPPRSSGRRAEEASRPLPRNRPRKSRWPASPPSRAKVVATTLRPFARAALFLLLSSAPAIAPID